jgi:ketosteroid isomerase-like protein
MDDVRCEADPSRGASDPWKHVEELLVAADAVRRALLGNDVDALTRLVAEDYCGFDPSGSGNDRKRLLEAYAPGGVRLLAYETRDVAARVVGEVGLVMGLGRLSGRFGDQPFEHNLRFLDVYVRRDAAWLLLVSQATERPAEASV